MKQVFELKTKYKMMVVCPNTLFIAFYSPNNQNVQIFSIETRGTFKNIKTNDKIISVTWSFKSENIIITTKYKLTAINIYTLSIEFAIFNPQNSIKSFLLQNKYKVCECLNTLKFFNVCNQEDFELHFDSYKIIDNNKILLLFNDILTVYNASKKTFKDICVSNYYNNLDYVIYKNYVVVMNGYKVTSKHHEIDFKKWTNELPTKFSLHKKYLILLVDKILYVMDRHDDSNCDLAEYAETTNLKYILKDDTEYSPKGYERVVVKAYCDEFHHAGNSLFVWHKDTLTIYNEIPMEDRPYINCVFSYVYIEKESEFDTSECSDSCVL